MDERFQAVATQADKAHEQLILHAKTCSRRALRRHDESSLAVHRRTVQVLIGQRRPVVAAALIADRT